MTVQYGNKQNEINLIKISTLQKKKNLGDILTAVCCLCDWKWSKFIFYVHYVGFTIIVYKVHQRLIGWENNSIIFTLNHLRYSVSFRFDVVLKLNSCNYSITKTKKWTLICHHFRILLYSDQNLYINRRQTVEM